MPNYLISSFAQLTNPTSGVEYLVLDPTDTSMAPTGTDKRITDANAIYSPATIVIAPTGSAHRADYYTTGTADDVQIQTAINAVNTAGGGVILIKEGTYSISATITLKSNVFIKGAGWNTILQMAANTNTTCLQNDPNTPATNMILQDFQIDMNSTNNTTMTNGKAIGFWTVTNSFIKNIWAKNIRHAQGQGNVAIGLNNCTNCIAEENYIYNVGDYGIASNGLQYCKIIDNFIQNPAGHGINMENGSTGGLFERPTGNIIRGNTVYYDSAETLANQNGIKIGRCDQCEISQNILYCTNKNGTRGVTTAEDNLANIGSSNYQRRNVISGNTIYGFSIGVKDEGGQGDVIADNTIQIPYIITTGGQGIYIAQSQLSGDQHISEELQITGNSIYEETNSADTNGAGILIDQGSSYINITGNTLYNMSHAGIAINHACNYITISSNTIRDPNKWAIYLGANGSDGTSYCVINDNLISGASRVSNAAASAINLNTGSSHNIISNNTFATPNSNIQSYAVFETDSTCDYNYYVGNNIQNTTTGVGININGLHSNVHGKTVTRTVAPAGIPADYNTDGVADEVQINAALTAVGTLGGIVVLREGTYTLSSGVLVPSNTILRGSGMWKTILKGANTSSIAYAVINTHSATIGDSNISLEDFQIDCNGTNQPSNFAANGIDLRLVTQFKIKNIWTKNAGFDDTTQAAGIGLDQSTKGTIEGCISNNNTHYGYSLYRSYDITCINCISYSNGRHGFGGGGDSQATVDHDITFTSCISFGDTQGFWLRELNGLTINACEVNGNSVVDTATTTAAGMIFAAVKNLSITNCRIHDIQGTNDGVRVDGSYLSQGETSRYTIITSNQFYNLAKNGIFMRSGSTQNAVIANNTFVNLTAGYGIINSQCNDATITGNYFEKTGLSGIIISQSQNCTISGNVIKNSGQAGNTSDRYGIFVWSNASPLSSNNVITGNRCYDDQGVKTQAYGVNEVATWTDSNTYLGNNVTGNLTAGMNLLGTNSEIGHNIGY